MKKLNRKGFLLTETLIVATMLVTILLILYVQFRNVNREFNTSFTYNTVGSSYNLYNAKMYIEKSNYSLIAEKLKVSEYVDLTECESIYFKDTDYCDVLFKRLGIKQVLMTNENLYSLIEKKDNGLSPEMNKYIKTIDYDKSDGYRIIGFFEDGTYSSLKILNSRDFDYNIANACNASVTVDYVVKHIAIDNDSDTDGLVLYDDTKGSGICGVYITSEQFAKTTNSCYYFAKTNSKQLYLSIDPSANVGTLYYKKYQSNLTIHHYLVGTTTPVSSDTVVTNFCGNKVYPEQYRKNISGYMFVSAANETVNMSKDDAATILYYKEVS